MTQRLYGLSGKTPEKALAGQAALIFAAMGGTIGTAPEFKTAKDWTVVVENIGAQDKAKELITRQDPYRVVMYYILVFKKRGLVIVREQNVDEPARTVSEATPIPERDPLKEPETEEELEAAIKALDDTTEGNEIEDINEALEVK